MVDSMKGNREGKKVEKASHRIRLPGFVTEKEIGLGDIVKRATSVVGVRPCGGCARRALALNRWMVFTGWRSR
jgi:hypothetical protein